MDANMNGDGHPDTDDAIAIVGMACRVPGAENIEEFWQILEAGREAVAQFDDDELIASGVDPREFDSEDYVKAGGYLTDFDTFDADFFGYAPREAELIDPQQRLFLQCAWNALEDAGCINSARTSTTGVFASAAANRYFLAGLTAANPLHAGAPDVEEYILAGPSVDYLPMRTAYKLGLTGPAIAVQSACSSSLVAVCEAAQNLLDYRCDMALAGGVALNFLGKTGYRYKREGILSIDGHCRAFDAEATGSVFGNGVGVIVLKRLSDAIAAGDSIRAVATGWAVNNDGNAKPGFSAPSVTGQSAVIDEALAAADIGPQDIGYVEAHGTGTKLGDAVETAALIRAFEAAGPRTRYCALGSVKTNIGHLGAAAGIISLIKTVLAVERGTIPPSLNLTRENPDLHLTESPFFVNTETRRWADDNRPRRAGVSSFGMGGTNAHMIIAQAEPRRPQRQAAARPYLLPASAKTQPALDRFTRLLGGYFAGENPASLHDVAYSLATGRAVFPHRAAIVCHQPAEAAKLLQQRSAAAPARVFSETTRPKLAFMFPGAGDHYAGMATDLYAHEPRFRGHLDACCGLFEARSAKNPRHFLIGDGDCAPEPVQPAAPKGAIDFRRLVARDEDAAASASTVHGALFCLEYALARSLIEVGLCPDMMIGHSVGEFAAACIAGIFSLDDAVMLVAERARLIDSSASGAMLTVPTDEDSLRARIDGSGISLAAVNAPELCVASGPDTEIDTLEKALARDGIVGRRLRVNRAYHSMQMQDVADRFAAIAAAATYAKPQIPLVSNLSGDWVTEGADLNADYWARHICAPVRFADGFAKLAAADDVVFLEVGPGQTLSSLATLQDRRGDRVKHVFAPTLSPYYDGEDSLAQYLNAIGLAWESGCEIDWDAFYRGNEGARVPLPVYPFERQRYWSLPAALTDASPAPVSAPDADRRAAVRAGVTAEVKTPSPPPDKARSTPGKPRPQTAGEYSAPITAVERQLAAIWRNLFGYDDVGATDDFFAIGGHSLLALQYSNILWRTFQVHVPLQMIVECPTIRALAGNLDLPGDRSQTETRAYGFVREDVGRQTDAELQAFLERYVIEKMNLARIPVSSADATPTAHDWARATPELLRSFKVDLGMQFYPIEVSRHKTPASLAAYLLREIRQAEDLRDRWTGPVEPAGQREANARKPGGADFILSSPRSGSTLFRLMLAGHSALFCPPELHLVGYDRMDIRRDKNPSPDHDQGLGRAFVELTGRSMHACAEDIRRMAEDRVPVMNVFLQLVDMAAPRRLIDKSPANADRMEKLRWIEANFSGARHIHLVRHPYSVIESIVRNRFAKLMGGDGENPFEFAEHAWFRSNANIVGLSEEVDADRLHIVRYEDLIRDSHAALEGVCGFLGIDFEAAMTDPYQGQRMRDGLGDPNLLDHHGIDRSLADVWQDIRLPAPLARHTRELAERFGYDLHEPRRHGLRPDPAGGKPAACKDNAHARSAATDPSSAYLVRLHEADGTEMMFFVHALDGSPFLYIELARLLGEHLSSFGIQAQAGGSTTLEGLAARYIDAIRAVQPCGPYRLCGWSMGGVVAFEMACQLRSGGEEVDFLGLIDSVCPSGSPQQQVDYSLVQFAMAIADGMGGDDRPTTDLEAVSRLTPERQLRYVETEISRMPAPMRKELQSRLVLWKRHVAMVRHYRPGIYDGDMTLVRARGPAGAARSGTAGIPKSNENWTHEDGVYGWRAHVGRHVDAIDVAAGHLDVCSRTSAPMVAGSLLPGLTRILKANAGFPHQRRRPDQDAIGDPT